MLKSIEDSDIHLNHLAYQQYLKPINALAQTQVNEDYLWPAPEVWPSTGDYEI